MDTASAGFFDADFFDDDEEVFENMDQFCCGGDGSAFPKHGVICASGYGDGGCPCFVSLDGDDAVATRIVFITELSSS